MPASIAGTAGQLETTLYHSLMSTVAHRLAIILTLCEVVSELTKTTVLSCVYLCKDLLLVRFNFAVSCREGPQFSFRGRDSQAISTKCQRYFKCMCVCVYVCVCVGGGGGGGGGGEGREGGRE